MVAVLNLSAPAAALHIACTRSLRPRCRQWLPRFSAAYREFAEAGFSRDDLDSAIEELCDTGIFDDGIPTGLTVKADLGSRRPPAHEWRTIREEVFARDNYTCAYCGIRGSRLECDHIVPVAAGGGHELSNLATACLPCNRSKRDKPLGVWKA